MLKQHTLAAAIGMALALACVALGRAANPIVKTIHQAIIAFNGKSCIFHHNDKLSGGAYQTHRYQ
ncbi:hypothetical protein [Janthinobacterium sp. JC611]|uniref:hypothetical protein n=1 Tax=Janthinobacterium sp. JC611 TaxID=2816201 RepID=UPI001BFCFB66|nr:hypothetical protein [Janthinobacterium sp. JC611]